MGKERVHFLKEIKKQAYSNKFLYLVRMIYRALGTSYSIATNNNNF